MTNWNAARPFFESTAVAHLSTLMSDGSPHSVPVWIAVEGERLVFFTEIDALKDKNLRRDPRVAVSVTAVDDPFAMAFVRGVAVERREGDDALPIVDHVARVYTGRPYPMREGLAAWVIEPRRAWARAYES
ncbi:TIGR03618 family F420-dependent PPOX class oxidoreductase [Microbacterium sp. ACRRU]|uniref:TIGR03618 family F420-dependent PPOX class oxidoreductase n=1 Tax=Microbacterium sp. ACRRU TaxID=2918204 RepID=UPI001EF672B8|nr:TIGR03618 family F420-dependent PPOX class oxidoreductase [Microbacterium sp. ACRRU]MCG7416631.1 TIGR03618 family F420-dependent PPOX class oxidoreductase [Microbacterium sp. ACRRU]